MKVDQRIINVHHLALTRLSTMACTSDMFPDSSRPIVQVNQAVKLNDKMVAVPCVGTTGRLDKLETYARGLSDAFNYCH
jgi:hypothetical protein